MSKNQTNRRGRGPHSVSAESPRSPGVGNGTWVMILGAIFLVLAGLTIWQYLRAKPAAQAEVWADGVLVRTLDLTSEGEYRIESAEGWNVLNVSGGKLAVTAASCPDGDCVRCGPRNTDPPIVCLPNRLSIQFSNAGTVDGVVR